MSPRDPSSFHKPIDRSHRLLFSHPRTIRDLLRGFIREPWVEELDFSSLEKLPSDYISGQLVGEFEERTSDVVWRVRWRDQHLYIVILLELQSTCEQDMALRMLVYCALFYQRLLKEQPLKRGERLPPVLPIVFYNGQPKWWAPLEVSELIEPVPKSFAAYLPSMRYCLIDEKRLPLADLEELVDNVVAGIARVEQDHGPAYLAQMVEQFAGWLDEPGQNALRRDVLAWLSKVVLPARVPNEEIPELRDLEEFQTYLEVNMQTWSEQWKAEGREEGLRIGRKEGMQLGRKEGMQLGRKEGVQMGRKEGVQMGREQGREEGAREGRVEGAAAVLMRQIRLKFGPSDAATQDRIRSANANQLLRWTENLLTAETVDGIFVS